MKEKFGVFGWCWSGNAFSTKGEKTMKKLILVALIAGLCTASCKEDEEAKECVLGCAEGEVCVDGDCETACETHKECFAKHGGGWHCEDASYCALGAPAEGEVPNVSEPKCVAKEEVCDKKDNDCDGQVDEGVKNACGKCGAVPSEVCDGKDNDCDGKTDEGLLNACGECGELPVEICDSVDNDCDGQTDEELLNACGQCGEVPAEVCDGVDNNCDGETDEGLLNACGACGPVPAEVCNGVDDDCDGAVPEVEADADADGYRVCDGDCNDSSALINPGATEICDGIDDNCNGQIMDGEWDEDADGMLACGGDCNDADKTIYFGAVELCNGIDDDCDGDTDEDFFVGVPCYGIGACGFGVYECATEFDYRCSTMTNGSADMSTAEVCSDNVDNDCDGSVDEGCACDEDDLMICGTTDVGVCKYALQVCQADGTWGECEDSIEPSVEVCNGVDDDCDGVLPADEADEDADGFMVCEKDCDDADAAVNPDATELCNGVDDDCDGLTDEDYFVGKPCTGYGACGAGVYECSGEIAFRCSTMPGGSADMSSEEVCSDNIDNNCEGAVDEGCSCEYNAEQVVYILCGETDVGACEFGTQECQPDGVWGECVGAISSTPEKCNGVDDDCDGVLPADEADEDADGFMVCEKDCDDAVAAVNPDGVELCNSVDDDCDGLTDEDYFVGAPCDGVGQCGAGKLECAGTEAVICSTNPGGSKDESALETCDKKDNDCDGSVDEGCECDPGDQLVCGTTSVGVCQFGWQVCSDDGVWGDCLNAIEPSVEVCNGADDDCDGAVDEGVLNACGNCGEVPVEICDGEDNDCDGSIDEGVLNACGQCGAVPTETCNSVDDDCDGLTDEDYFVGAPCDGVGQCGAGKLECAGTDAVVCSTNPGASKDESKPEVCGDNIDNDCDGSVDEGCDCDPADQKVCGTSDIGVCQFGWQVCDNDGKWGVCLNSVEPQPEVCNGADDDCDGAVDEGVLNACGNCGEVPVEVCDGADNDCDGSVDEGVLNACGECGAVPTETCNSVDDDCDGLTDEDYFVGVPCDGVGECGLGKLECAGTEAVICSTNPGGSKDESALETCDKKDNDCDGSVDEGCECDPGDQLVCGTTNVGVCQFGWQICSDDGVWGDCLNAIEPSVEVCNGADDDCDGAVDEGVLNACGNCGDVPVEICDGADNDCDGSVDEGVLNACGQCGAVPTETCNSVDDDCDGLTDEDYFVGAPCDGVGQCGAGKLECAGTEAVICSTNPGGSKDESALETCDKKDNDCDGSVDEGCECDPGNQLVCGTTSVGVCQFGWQVCSDDGVWGDCLNAIEPSAEVCNGADDDCDGAVGAGEVDFDADGFMICEGDCNDDNASVNPATSELCNGVDDNCNGETDEGFFVGVPCNGLGVCGVGVYECAGNFGYQCSTMPGASKDASKAEVCGDNADNDCDGSVDEDCECDPGDLAVCGSSDVGVCQKGTQVCGADGKWQACQGSVEPSSEQCNGLDDNCNGAVPANELDEDADGYLVCENDCNDDNAAINPAASELCNGVDDDCDGLTDEGYFIGAPCVGVGKCGLGKSECAGTEAVICSTNPGGSKDESALETCDKKDNDCDGELDEGCECDPDDQLVCGTSAVGECQLGWQECDADGQWDVCVGNVEPTEEACNGLDDDCNGLVPSDEADADKDGWRVCEGDCDDTDKDVNPGEAEICNGDDDDCNGTVDEDCSAVSCNICCGYGLGHPVVWWGADPPNTWSADGYCGVWTGTVQQICLRGDYPVPGYTDAGWVDWNCQNGTSWGGWTNQGVLWCVDDLGQPVDYEVVSGQVDPALPNPEGEIILLDGLCQ